MRHLRLFCCFILVLTLLSACGSNIDKEHTESESSIISTHTKESVSSSGSESSAILSNSEDITQDSGSESDSAAENIEDTLPYEGTGIAESSATEITIMLPARELTVKIIDTNNEPVVNAMVSVNDTAAISEMFTNANGESTLYTETLQYSDVYTFGIKMMRPTGDFVYEEVPMKIDLLAAESPINVKLSIEKVENEYMRSPDVIELLFVDKDNNPIPNVWCSVGSATAPYQPGNTSQSAQSLFLTYGYSNSDGKRYLVDLTDGDYIINASTDWGLFQTKVKIDNNDLIICEIGNDSMRIRSYA